MAFDGIVTKSVIAELQSTIISGKITKIFQPNRNEIILGIYANGNQYALDISIDSNSYYLHLTTHSKPNPLQAPNFCMLLRKYLLGYRIKSIETFDLERVVTIYFEGFNELNDLTTKKLIVELMGRHSNIILLNQQNFIIDSLRHLDQSSHSSRDILPAHEYYFPQNEKKSFLDLSSFNEFYSIIETEAFSSPLENLIVTHFIGFSYPFVQYMIEFLNITPTSYTLEDLKLCYHYIQDIILYIKTNRVSLIPYINKKEKSDYVLTIQEKSSSLSINFFLDDYYYQKELQGTFINYRNNILKLILNTLSKYKGYLKSINQKLEECSNKELYKLYGELITANLYQIKSKKQSSITLENYYNNNELLTIPLDSSISIQANAKKFFKKYTKLKNAFSIVSSQKKETEKDLNYIESIIYEIESCKSIEDINDIYSEISESYLFKHLLSSKSTNKKTKDQSSHPREYNVDGYTILVGKNNIQNDYISTKLAFKTDLWFHTKEIHGSHVILKTEHTPLEKIPKTALVTAAQIAAYYSKATLSSNVPVDYCYVKYVKKPSGSKPGMVIYSNNQTINVNPSDAFPLINSHRILP